MLVDVAVDVAVEVREQNTAVTEPHGADGRWCRVDGPCDLQRSIIAVTLVVHGRAVGVARAEINVV